MLDASFEIKNRTKAPTIQSPFAAFQVDTNCGQSTFVLTNQRAKSDNPSLRTYLTISLTRLLKRMDLL